MIIITGAAGFIGSCLIARLNEYGITRIVIVDDFTKPLKGHNLVDKKYSQKIDRTEFVQWLTTFCQR